MLKKWWFYFILVIAIVIITVTIIFFYTRKAEYQKEMTKYVGEWVVEETFHLGGYKINDTVYREIDGVHKQTLEIENETFFLEWYDLENGKESTHKLFGECRLENNVLILTVTEVKGDKSFLGDIYECEYDEEDETLRIEKEESDYLYTQYFVRKDSVGHSKIKCVNQTEDIIYYLERNICYAMYMRYEEELSSQYFIKDKRAKVEDNKCIVKYEWKDATINFVYDVETCKLEYIEFTDVYSKYSRTTYKMDIALLEGLLYSIKNVFMVSTEGEIINMQHIYIMKELVDEIDYDDEGKTEPKKIEVMSKSYKIEYSITEGQTGFKILVRY